MLSLPKLATRRPPFELAHLVYTSKLTDNDKYLEMTIPRVSHLSHPPRFCPAYPGGASGLLAARSGVSFVLLRELRSEPKSILPQIQVLTLSTPSLQTWIPDKPDINVIRDELQKKTRHI